MARPTRLEGTRVDHERDLKSALPKAPPKKRAGDVVVGQPKPGPDFWNKPIVPRMPVKTPTPGPTPSPGRGGVINDIVHGSTRMNPNVDAEGNEVHPREKTPGAGRGRR